MKLSNELYFRKYWKAEEILFLIFGKCKDKNGSGFVTRRDEEKIEDVSYDAKNFTLFKSEFEEEISKAIKSGDLKKHKALDDDNPDYLGRHEFSDWLNLKYKIDINHYLSEERSDIMFDEKPDYRDFSDRVYGGGTFTRHEAFCYLRGIPINKDKTTWSDDDIRNFLKFDAYENDKEKLTYKEILAIAGKENINVSREIEIIIEEAERFGTQDQKKTAINWHNITLTLLADKLIEYSFEGGGHKKSLEDIGLAKQGNQKLTKPGGVLLGLSNQSKYPVNKSPDDSERQDISKIRDALKKLCGLTDDPFHPFNPIYGWTLKCALINNTRLSEQRAKDRAPHEIFDDNKHSPNIDDVGLALDGEKELGQAWLDKRAGHGPNVDDEDNDPNNQH